MAQQTADVIDKTTVWMTQTSREKTGGNACAADTDRRSHIIGSVSNWMESGRSRWPGLWEMRPLLFLRFICMLLWVPSNLSPRFTSRRFAWPSDVWQGYYHNIPAGYEIFKTGLDNIWRSINRNGEVCSEKSLFLDLLLGAVLWQASLLGSCSFIAHLWFF